jgi:RHS repeat-associated protein
MATIIKTINMSRIYILFLLFSLNFYSQTHGNGGVVIDPDFEEQADCKTYYYDGDGDGFGAGEAQCLFVQPLNWVKFSGDCDDNDPAIYPRFWFIDNDNDGFGTGSISNAIRTCYQPIGRAPSLGDCDDNNSNINPNTIWYSDSDLDGYGDPSEYIVQCIQPIGYVLNNLDLCPQFGGGGISSMNGCPRFSNENYIYEVILQEEVSDENLIFNIESTESIEYYDGLGRGKQKILISNGGQGQDIVTHSEYDSMGRKSREFLPFASVVSANGLMYNNSFSETLAFYNTLKYENTTNPYSETRFDSSPLSRVLEVGSPGLIWKLDSHNDYDNTIKKNYEFNTNLDKVRRLNASIDALGNYTLIDNNYYQSNELFKNIVKNENWQPTQIYLNDNITIEFKDKLQRVILKRNFNNDKWHDTYYVYDDIGNLIYVLPPQLNSYPDSQQIWDDQYYEFQNVTSLYASSYTTGEENEGYFSLNNNVLDFYFENYDEGPNAPLNTNNVALVIPFSPHLPDMPLGNVTIKLFDGSLSDQHYTAEIIGGNLHLIGDGTPAYAVYFYGNLDITAFGTGSILQIDQLNLNKLAYQYKYDKRKRLIEKKLPGKDWEYIIYDKLDRTILVQDVNLRSSNTWLFTKYDSFNRIAYTGKWINPIPNQSRKDLQSIIDLLTNPISVVKSLTALNYGTYNGSSSIIYYSNEGFPTESSQFEISSITYYDDYSFDTHGLNIENSFSVVPTSNVKGLKTATKSRILDTNDWTTSIIYYDEKGRPIYIPTKNDYLGKTDKVKNKLDFVGKNLVTETTHIDGANTLIIKDFYEYDHAGRLLSVKNQINNLSIQLLAKNTYDEIGQLIKKEIGNTELTPLQKVDLTYNIRGWMKRINNVSHLGDDLFAFTLKYEDSTPLYSLSNPGKPLYNGNISSIDWKTNNISSSLKTYQYKYDNLNRLSDSWFLENSTPNYKFNERVSKYDRNGNIINLQRNSESSSNPLYSQGIDNLKYEYVGNQLMSVKDYYGLSANGIEGFKDENTVGDDFSYDFNGNLKVDHNKGITLIEYNYLNLPTKIVFNYADIGSTNPKVILYKYDSNGIKIEKIVKEPKLILGILNNTTTTVQYDGIFQYLNNELSFFSNQEGYVNCNGGSSYEYVFQYKDHLGNIRLSYSDSNNDGVITGNSSEIFYDDFEGPSGWESQADVFNFGGSVSEYDVTKKNSGNASGRIDKLTPGEFYVQNNTWININNAGPTNYILSGWVYSNGPSAEVFLMQNTATETGYVTIPTSVYISSLNKWSYFEKIITVPSNIAKLSIRLDNNGGGSVWFDDISIRKVNSNNEIIRENNYYAFGLEHKKYNNINSPFGNDLANNYKYQGQERQDEIGLNWDSFKWRNYDYAIGRFMSIDPLAEKYNYQSPYNFAENRVVDGNELEGLEWVDADKNLVYDPNLKNGRRGYTVFATTQDYNYGNALKSTPTGTEQFNKLITMTHPVLILHNTTDMPLFKGEPIYGASITPKKNNPEGKTTITVFEKNIDELVGKVNDEDMKDALYPLHDGKWISIKGITKVYMLGVTLGEEVEHATDENIKLQHEDIPDREEIEKTPNQISDKILKESMDNN